ncbi:MAG: phospho-sugar mutase, partial [Myxococcota bacterium]
VSDAPVEALPLVYTAMHGVGGPLFLRALERRGFRQVTPVAEQLEPDPAFPTVAFPNPEEKGALDLAVATAERADAELVLAHDPDADRLGAVVRCPRRGWKPLTGNDIGVLLARYLIDHDEPGDTSRLVVNTVVSSRLLERMARDLGVRYAEALTGFKNISKVMMNLEEKESLRPLLGYEEALGYAVSADVRDKDGITAGLVLAEMAAVARAEGRTLLDMLEAIHRAHGLFVGSSRSVVMSGLDGPERIQRAMTALRGADLDTLRGMGVRQRWDLQTGTREDTGRDPSSGPSSASPYRANVLVFELSGGGRVAVRPSGTEPKLKLYLEREVPWPAEATYEEVVSRARSDLEAIERGFLALGEIPSGR